LDNIRGGGGLEIAQPKKESIELPPIVVRPQTEKISAPQEQIQEPIPEIPSAGKILAVNRDDNFAIINMGEDLGIRVGDTFQVYRKGKPIAIIEVIKTRRSIAACEIKTEITPIQLEDTIR
jgi:hypothetical protein